MRSEMKEMPSKGVYGKKEGAESIGEGKMNKGDHRDSDSKSELGGKEYPSEGHGAYGQKALDGDLKHAVKFLERDIEGEEGKESPSGYLGGKKHDQHIG